MPAPTTKSRSRVCCLRATSVLAAGGVIEPCGLALMVYRRETANAPPIVSEGWSADACSMRSRRLGHARACDAVGLPSLPVAMIAPGLPARMCPVP